MKQSLPILLCYGLLGTYVQAMQQVTVNDGAQSSIMQSGKKQGCCCFYAPKINITTDTVAPAVHTESHTQPKLDLSSATIALFFTIFHHNVVGILYYIPS